MSERDTHFQGFAKLLIPELDEQVGAVTQWGLEHDANENEIARELISRWSTLIAQFAYDLVLYSLEQFQQRYDWGFGTLDYPLDVLQQIPDMTEWPTDQDTSRQIDTPS